MQSGHREDSDFAKNQAKFLILAGLHGSTGVRRASGGRRRGQMGLERASGKPKERDVHQRSYISTESTGIDPRSVLDPAPVKTVAVRAFWSQLASRGIGSTGFSLMGQAGGRAAAIAAWMGAY